MSATRHLASPIAKSFSEALRFDTEAADFRPEATAAWLELN